LQSLVFFASNKTVTAKDIKRQRAALGMTQPEFAKRLKVALRTVTKWEAEGCPNRWDELLKVVVRQENMGFPVA